MSKEQRRWYQWFIITAIGGREDSIVQALKEKINNFGYNDWVKEIKVFKEETITVDEFSPNSSEIPSKIRNSKTIKWEVLPNGYYRRTKTKVENKFKGYIFIYVDMKDDVWYAIRNTIGVLGFVGSTGKGAKPIPISQEEYERLVEAKVKTNEPTTEVKENVKQEVKECIFKVGHSVVIRSESLLGEKGIIKTLDLEKQTATVEYYFFSRANIVTIPFEELELDK